MARSTMPLPVSRTVIQRAGCTALCCMAARSTPSLSQIACGHARHHVVAHGFEVGAGAIVVRDRGIDRSQTLVGGQRHQRAEERILALEPALERADRHPDPGTELLDRQFIEAQSRNIAAPASSSATVVSWLRR